MKLTMQSLFLKIFFWFWATAFVTGIAVVITFILGPGGVPSRWHSSLTDTAQIFRDDRFGRTGTRRSAGCFVLHGKSGTRHSSARLSFRCEWKSYSRQRLRNIRRYALARSHVPVA